MIAVEEHDIKRAYQKSSDKTVGLGGSDVDLGFGAVPIIQQMIDS